MKVYAVVYKDNPPAPSMGVYLHEESAYYDCYYSNKPYADKNKELPWKVVTLTVNEMKTKDMPAPEFFQ